MKKIICLILMLAFVLSLASCGGEKYYEPVESTDEESRVVMTIEYEDKSYEIKYELYRALFLTLKSEVDGGDSSVWTGDAKDEYIERIDALINDRIAEIYSAFHIADKIGVDVFSKSYEKQIKKYIKASVDGGYAGASKLEGYGGDYSKYLDSLKEKNLNYSVSVLMIRYSLALSAINDYYAGSQDNSNIGNIQYTKEDIEEFYRSYDCVRVFRLLLPFENYSKERAEEIRNDIAEKNGDEEVFLEMIKYTLGYDLEFLIARHSLNKNYYGEMTDAAFALENFTTSDVIELKAGTENGYVIIYRSIKSDDYFGDCYDEVAYTYVQNEIGKILDEAAEAIGDAIVNDTYLNELDRSEISMK